MKRVGSVPARSRCGWCRAATTATARRTGKGWAATAGALPRAEMQMAQRLESPEAVAWV